MIIKIEEESDIKEKTDVKWTEYVTDLWSHDKLEHLREVSRPTAGMFDEVFDPVKGLYGFEMVSQEDVHMLDSYNDDSFVPEEEPPSVEPVPIINPSHPEPVTTSSANIDSNLSKIASNITAEDIADYLRSLKLDIYVEAFLDHDIDGDMMIDVDHDFLESLGVDTKKDRMKIIGKFKQWLRKKSPDDTN